nr:cell division protein [Chlorosarcina stigmatica]
MSIFFKQGIKHTRNANRPEKSASLLMESLHFFILKDGSLTNSKDLSQFSHNLAFPEVKISALAGYTKHLKNNQWTTTKCFAFKNTSHNIIKGQNLKKLCVKNFSKKYLFFQTLFVDCSMQFPNKETKREKNKILLKSIGSAYQNNKTIFLFSEADASGDFQFKNVSTVSSNANALAFRKIKTASSLGYCMAGEIRALNKPLKNPFNNLEFKYFFPLGEATKGNKALFFYWLLPFIGFVTSLPWDFVNAKGLNSTNHISYANSINDLSYTGIAMESSKLLENDIIKPQVRNLNLPTPWSYRKNLFNQRSSNDFNNETPNYKVNVKSASSYLSYNNQKNLFSSKIKDLSVNYLSQARHYFNSETTDSNINVQPKNFNFLEATHMILDTKKAFKYEAFALPWHLETLKSLSEGLLAEILIQKSSIKWSWFNLSNPIKSKLITNPSRTNAPKILPFINLNHINRETNREISRLAKTNSMKSRFHYNKKPNVLVASQVNFYNGLEKTLDRLKQINGGLYKKKWSKASTKYKLSPSVFTNFSKPNLLKISKPLKNKYFIGIKKLNLAVLEPSDLKIGAASWDDQISCPTQAFSFARKKQNLTIISQPNLSYQKASFLMDNILKSKSFEHELDSFIYKIKKLNKFYSLNLGHLSVSGVQWLNSASLEAIKDSTHLSYADAEGFSLATLMQSINKKMVKPIIKNMPFKVFFNKDFTESKSKAFLLANFIKPNSKYYPSHSWHLDYVQSNFIKDRGFNSFSVAHAINEKFKDFTILKMKHPWLNVKNLNSLEQQSYKDSVISLAFPKYVIGDYIPKNKNINHVKLEGFKENLKPSIAYGPENSPINHEIQELTTIAKRSYLNAELLSKENIKNQANNVKSISSKSYFGETYKTQRFQINSHSNILVFKNSMQNFSQYLNYIVRKAYLSIQDPVSYTNNPDSLNTLSIYKRSSRSLEKIIRAKLSLRNKNSYKSIYQNKLNKKFDRIVIKLNNLNNSLLKSKLLNKNLNVAKLKRSYGVNAPMLSNSISPTEFLKNKKLVAAAYNHFSIADLKNSQTREATLIKKSLNVKNDREIQSLDSLYSPRSLDAAASRTLLKKKIKQQKQHRIKKYELDSRRTFNKKRSRGYPRPEWLRLRLYEKLVKTRWNKSINKNLLNNAPSVYNKEVRNHHLSYAKLKPKYLTGKVLKLDSMLSFNSGNFYNVSKNTLRYLKMAESESYWLRSHLNPYLGRIQHYLNDTRTLESQWQFFLTIRTFISSLLGFSDNHFNDCSTKLKWERAIAMSDYNRIVYDRTQTVLAGVKQNLNSNGQNKIRSFNVGRLKIKALKQRILEDIFMSSKIAKNTAQNTDKFSKGLKRSFEQSLKLKRSSYWLNPSAKIRPYWAFHKTNTVYFQQMSKAHRLWTNQKLKEQAFANKTKFLQKKILSRWDALFAGDLQLAKFIANSVGLRRFINFVDKETGESIRYPKFYNSTENAKEWDFRISQKARQKEEKINYLVGKPTRELTGKAFNMYTPRSANASAFRIKMPYFIGDINRSYNNKRLSTTITQRYRVPNNLFSYNNAQNYLEKLTTQSNSLQFKRIKGTIENKSMHLESYKASKVYSLNKKNILVNPTSFNIIDLKLNTLLLYACTLLFHFCTLISLLSIPQVRCFIKFHLILIFKLVPVSIQIIHSILDCFKNYSFKISAINKKLKNKLYTGEVTHLNLLKTPSSFGYCMAQRSSNENFLTKTTLNATNIVRINNVEKKVLTLFKYKPYFTKKNYIKMFYGLSSSNDVNKKIKTVSSYLTRTQKHLVISLSASFKKSPKVSALAIKPLPLEFRGSHLGKPLLRLSFSVVREFHKIKRIGVRLYIICYLLLTFLGSKIRDNVKNMSKETNQINVSTLYKFIENSVPQLFDKVNIFRHLKGPTNVLGQTREFVLITDFLADFLIISWASDLITLIPEKVDLDIWNYTLKLSRGTRILMPLTERSILNLFDIFVETLSQPDTDLILRQKKGTIFWDIWGDFLIKAAEEYKIHIPSISQYKEEQTLLVDNFLDQANKLDTPRRNVLESYFAGFVNNGHILKGRPLFWEYSNFYGGKVITNSNRSPSIANSFELRSRSARDSWSVDQYLTYQSKETSLLIDMHPPKSFSHIGALKYYSKTHQCIGTLVCQIYSGILTKKASKNVLVVGASGVRSQEKSLLIQALAGETEFKILTDNALPYATLMNGAAVGIKVLKDVFEAIVVHAPCIFLLEDIHIIGERRPISMADDENTGAFDDLVSSSGVLNSPLQIHEKNQVFYEVFRHSINHYKKPFRGDFSLLIPTNHFSVDLFLGVSPPRSRQGVQWNSTLSYPIKYNSQQTNIQNSGASYGANTNILASSLQLPSDQLFAPPATSPLSVLVLKEQKKLKPRKTVNDLPFTGITNEQLALIPKVTYSIRLKVALLAELAMSKLSGKFEMVTDLLMILDSVRSQRGFIVFATTHSPSILDPALRRPGRLDETIYLPTIPNLWSRWEVLKSSLSTVSKPFIGSFFGFPKGCTLDYLANSKMQKIIQLRAANLLDCLDLSTTSLYIQQNFGHKTISEVMPQNLSTIHLGNTSFAKNKKFMGLANKKINHFSEAKVSYAKPSSNERYQNKPFTINNKFLALGLHKQNIKAITYFNISKKLINTQLCYNGNNYNGIVWNASNGGISVATLNKIGGENILESEELHEEERYLSFYSPQIILKQQLLQLFAGKVGESLAFSNILVNPFSSKEKNQVNLGRLNFVPKTNVLQNFANTHLSAYGIDDTWRSATSLVLALIQKRYLYSKNKVVLRLLNFVDQSTTGGYLEQPSGPPSFAIFAPAKRYENYKRTERDFQRKAAFSILDKIQMHQQQRFTRRLYRLPVKEFFRSETIENGLTTFTNISRILGPLDLSTPRLRGLAHKTTSVNWYYRKRILMRHRHYLNNQWWNGQLPEHNTETVFLSDVDWRYHLLESLEDILIDFPDSDQHYNPKRRRWMSTSGSWTYNISFPHEQILDQEIYTHYILESYLKAYNFINKNREILDYLSFKFMKLGYIEEIQLINSFKSFSKHQKRVI